MIKTLRRKFVGVALFSVTVVVLFVVVALNVSNYEQIYRHPKEIIQLLQAGNGIFEKFPDDGKPKVISPEERFAARYFTAWVSLSGDILSIQTEQVATISKDIAKQYVEEALKSDKEEGQIGDYLYNTTSKTEGVLVVFVNTAREQDMVRTFLINTLWISFICLSAVFVLLLILSRYAIRPIVESYEKQKQFITDASHELKTPLAIINTNTEVLEMISGESQWTESIKKQSLRLSDLVENLVTLARMDETSYLHISEPFDLTLAVSEEANRFAAYANTREKSIVQEIADNMVCEGDESAIRQMLALLLDNAIKYAISDAEIILTVQPHGKRHLIVCENSVAVLEKGDLMLWTERFYRPDASRNRESGGHGIGLSIVKAIVEKHRGKMRIYSPDNNRVRIEILI